MNATYIFQQPVSLSLETFNYESDTRLRLIKPTIPKIKKIYASVIPYFLWCKPALANVLRF